MSRRGCLPLLILILVLLALGIIFILPALASYYYGPPNPSLGSWQLIKTSGTLLWYDGLLVHPASIYGPEQDFVVEPGEPVASIASRLQRAGLLQDAGTLSTYLVYSGLDTTIQAGKYRFSPSMSPIDIAKALQDATPAQVDFTILPGWRMEEIAASLPTSGLNPTPKQFLEAAKVPPRGLDFLNGVATTEGFLFPDTYTLPRDISPDQLVTQMVRDFALHLTPDLRDGFARQNLTVYQAVTLASLVEKESVVTDEQPLIASVFLNRIRAGMKLESDPTVQYALGYDNSKQTWWKNPLSLQDLQFNSPFNTYVYPGLPPTPISNPSQSALSAVAYPAQTPYLYFRARCDGSGRHNFSETFEQHLQNACP